MFPFQVAGFRTDVWIRNVIGRRISGIDERGEALLGTVRGKQAKLGTFSGHWCWDSYAILEPTTSSLCFPGLIINLFTIYIFGTLNNKSSDDIVSNELLLHIPVLVNLCSVGPHRSQRVKAGVRGAGGDGPEQVLQKRKPSSNSKMGNSAAEEGCCCQHRP